MLLRLILAEQNLTFGDIDDMWQPHQSNERKEKVPSNEYSINNLFFPKLENLESNMKEQNNVGVHWIYLKHFWKCAIFPKCLFLFCRLCISETLFSGYYLWYAEQTVISNCWEQQKVSLNKIEVSFLSSVYHSGK